MTPSHQYYCYMLASQRNGTLYTGVTSDLLGRVYQHKSGMVEGFTQKHEVHQLVWYETFQDIEQAILREKQIKKWNRSWKLRLIESTNSDWRDLYLDLTEGSSVFLDSRLRRNDTRKCVSDTTILVV